MKKIRIIRTSEDLRTCIEWMQRFKIERPLQVTFEHYKKRRSTSQNSLYWMWIHLIASETGNEAEDLHLFFKTKFLAESPKEVLGQTIMERTTKDLSTTDMSEYMMRVESFAATELNIALPEAGQTWQ